MTMSEPEANVEEKRREDAHSREILSMLHTAAVLCHNTQDSNLLSAAVNGFGNITLGGMAGALVGFEFGRSGFSENLKVGLRRSGLGVLIFIGSTLLGVASAVGEMFYGTKNTLQTLQQGCTPVRVWNEIDGKWADPVLDDDIPTEDGDVDEAAFQRFREKYPVDESEVGQITARPSALYDQLGVSPTASAEEITRAYRRQAVQLHPDRHRDDPNATQRFQDLRSTYDVLSNPITRLRYDEGVVESTEEDGAELPFGTVRTCLTTVVGTEAIEPLVGRINLELLLRPRSSYDREMYSTLQYRRRMRVARTLARFLDDESDDFALASTVFEGVQLGSLVGSYLIHYVADEYKKATSVSVDVLPSRFSLFVQAARAYNQYRTEMTMSQETIASVVASLIEEDARCTTAFACSIVLKDLNATKEVRERRRCRLYQLSQFAKKYTTPHHVITSSPENA